MKRTLFYLTVFAFAFTGCSEFEEPERIAETDDVVASATAAPQTRAGAANVFEQMANPYDLALMRQLKNNPSLQPTHLYVRFLPADSAQLNTLEDKLDLDLFDYPLDVNIEDDEIYVDPSIPAGQFSWQYTAVPANFSFPSGIRKEILQQCYIPAEEEEAPPATRAGGESNLERLAILACGYELLPETRANGDKKPDGKVEVWDNSLNKNVPVKGVRVKCHYFLKVGKDYTDAKGKYSISKKFHVKPHYTVVFKNEKGFIIWDQIGISCRAKYHVKSRQIADGYDILIEPDLVGTLLPNSITRIYDRSWQEAAVNNGAYDYYTMCEATGIAKPPKGLRILVHPSMGNSAPMMRRMSVIQTLTKANWATFLGARTGLTTPVTITDALFKFLEPDVTINAESNNYRNLYESANHELSHASHFTKVGSDYWSKYISYIVQHNGYGRGRGQGSYYGICEVGEMWGFAMGHIQEHAQYSLATNVPYPYRIREGEDGDWIRPHPIWALITRGILTKKQVFDCLTSDVDTRDKLINKLCSGKSADVAIAIRTAFTFNDVPVVTGNNPSGLNVYATYAIPTAGNLSSDFTFRNWAISPNSGYTTTGGLNNRNLTIRFTTTGTYAVSAIFALPNGSTYTATRTVSFLPPKPDTPAIYGSGATQVSLPGYDAPVFWARPGTGVEFRIYNVYQYGSQVTFEWLVPTGTHTGRSYTYNIPSNYGSGMHGIWCFANDGGSESDIGVSYLYVSSVSPMSMPLKAQKALVEQVNAMPKPSKEELSLQLELLKQQN